MARHFFLWIDAKGIVMRINKEHQHHGSAIMQIAEEQEHFKAINPLMVGGKKSRIALLVNTNIAVYPKWAGEPHGRHEEYVFTFKPENIKDLEAIAALHPKTFLLLVCVEVGEVCCITFQEFKRLYQAWRKKVGEKESKQFTLIVTTPPNAKCRVYANLPGRRGIKFGEFLRSRSDFPSMIFDKP